MFFTKTYSFRLQLRFLLLLTGMGIIASCEDVIEVEVPSEEPRLIIEALIRVDTTQAVTPVRVKVSETASFFDEPQPVTLDQITLAGAILLEESPGSGIYARDVPTSQLMQEDLFIAIDYNGQIFAGFTDFAYAVPIDTLEQCPGGPQDNETELIIGFTDPAEVDNYYLLDFDLNEFQPTRDQFYDGQAFEFSFFYDEQLESGTTLTVSILGATSDFYQYMEKLLEQTEDELDLFDTPAVTVRGNILNASDIETISDLSEANLETNFPLGYFAVVQEYKQTVIIK